MREVGNTLYVQTQGTYLRVASETVEASLPDGGGTAHVPLQHLESIAVFGNVLVSPFLVQRCADDGRPIVWFTRSGRYRGRLSSPAGGNVLLRQAQYRSLDDEVMSSNLAARFVAGKIQNARTLLQRAARDAEGGANTVLRDRARRLDRLLRSLPKKRTVDEVRGVEGAAGDAYWGAFPHLVKAKDAAFVFHKRTKRPPEDATNAVLSFLYAVLANDCASACERAGLDPQAGYLHTLRPGRPSLALDLMEEFRAQIVDRLVLKIVNRRQVNSKHFVERPGGAVELTENGRKRVLDAYQKRRNEEVEHPLLKGRIPVGLLPSWQATLLARTVRGDTDAYRPWLAKV